MPLGLLPGTPLREGARNELRFWLMQMGLKAKTQDVSGWKLRTQRPYDDQFEPSRKNFTGLTSPFRQEFSRWRMAWVQNSWFEAGDAEFYYSLVRRQRPSLIIEVGAGWCTRFALEALRRNGRGRLLAIDPDARSAIPAAARRLCQRFEDTDPGEFAALQPGDILFIDSSHTGEEARRHTQLLERLPPGVFIHHHDVCYPYEPLYDEEGVILDYYHAQGWRYRIVCGLAFAVWQSREECAAAVPSLRWNPQRSPRSLWVEKTR